MSLHLAVDRLVRPNTANEHEPVHTCQGNCVELISGYSNHPGLLDAPFGAISNTWPMPALECSADSIQTPHQFRKVQKAISLPRSNTPCPATSRHTCTALVVRSSLHHTVAYQPEYLVSFDLGLATCCVTANRDDRNLPATMRMFVPSTRATPAQSLLALACSSRQANDHIKPDDV
jgi:hypothetical protein